MADERIDDLCASAPPPAERGSVASAGGGPTPPRALGPILAVTADEMAEVDRRTVADLGVELLQMMELAGRALGRLARTRFLAEATVAPPHVVLLAGPGGNGGGTLVAARRLAGWGVRVTVVTSSRAPDLSSAAAHQARALRAQGIALNGVDCLDGIREPIDLVIDGLLGYRGRGEPRGAVRDAISWLLAGIAPVLALDVPSGLDASSGAAAAMCVHATATLTLAAPKTGLLAARAEPFVGALYLADIGVPPVAYAGFPSPSDPRSWFVGDDVIRLR